MLERGVETGGRWSPVSGFWLPAGWRLLSAGAPLLGPRLLLCGYTRAPARGGVAPLLDAEPGSGGATEP
jgi:hypothetical protein